MLIMSTMEDAEKRLRVWWTIYWGSLFLPIALISAYTAFVLSYNPDDRLILFNMQGGVYSNEDLGKTDVSEGQVKQFVYESISKSFYYHYINYRSEADYELLIAGKLESDSPDHRDYIRPLFSERAFLQLVKDLDGADWMTRFHSQRRQLHVTFTAPPVRNDTGGWTLSGGGRLNMSYHGHFFVTSTAKGLKSVIYKVEYSVIAERKPVVFDYESDTYYEPSLVPLNAFEWRIKNLKWSSEKR
jgi:hypothetical protein